MAYGASSAYYRDNLTRLNHWHGGDNRKPLPDNTAEFVKGVLSGSTNTPGEKAGRVIAWTVAGTATGGLFAGPVGAAIGAPLGATIGAISLCAGD